MSVVTAGPTTRSSVASRPLVLAVVLAVVVGLAVAGWLLLRPESAVGTTTFDTPSPVYTPMPDCATRGGVPRPC